MAGYHPGNRGIAERKAARQVEALKLRQKGLTYRQIANELGCTTPTALRNVREALVMLAKERTEETENLRTLELSRLDTLAVDAYRVLEATHYMVSAGSVVTHGEEELIDTAPVLRAIDRLIKISERRCALLGLDAQAKENSAANDIADALKKFAEAALQ